MWQKGRQGEKAGNQNHCCDHVAQDHCCGNAAHQKSQQPIVRDGKVGVSRLPEEDTREDHCGNAAHDHCCDNAVHQKSHQPIARGKVGVAWLCGDTTNIVIRIYPFHFHQMHICKHFTRSSYLSSATRAFPYQPTQRIARRGSSRRGSSVRRSRRRSRLRFRKGIYFWSGLLLSPLYGLLIFQNRKIISFIILCEKYKRTCSFRLNWNQKTKVMSLIFLHFKRCAMAADL